MMFLLKNKGLNYLLLSSLVLAMTAPMINFYFLYPRYKSHLISHTEHDAIELANHLARVVTGKHDSLAEDFIEPFRYIVDLVILEILKTSDKKELSPLLKKEIILKILEFKVRIGDKNYRLFQAVDEAVYGFCSCLADTRKNLVLPNNYILRGAKRSKCSPQHIKYES